MKIIKWLKVGSEAEVRRGIKAIYPRLWRYSFVLTGSKVQADDLVQAACLRALEKANTFEAGTHFDRWIFRLTQRLWLNELRSNAVRAGGGLMNVEDADLKDTALDPEDNAIGRDIVKNVMQLPEAQRSTVILVYVEGHSYRDAAMILDIPVGTVMSRLANAREKLNQKFRSESEAG